MSPMLTVIVTDERYASDRYIDYAGCKFKRAKQLVNFVLSRLEPYESAQWIYEGEQNFTGQKRAKCFKMEKV